MKRPTELEEAALVAAFSYADAIDAISTGNASTAKANPRPRTVRPGQHPDIWHGWAFVGDELVDGGGNRYGQSEIRAIFYTRALLWHYREEEKARMPIVEALPVQLCLAGVPPAWQVLCNR